MQEASLTMHRFSRTEMLIGSQGLQTLQNSAVAVFGVGGVGSWVAEALARSGVGRITLIDLDNAKYAGRLGDYENYCCKRHVLFVFVPAQAHQRCKEH